MIQINNEITDGIDLSSELIPSSLKDIVSYCGEKTAMVLLLNFPGVHVRIPKKPTFNHKLAELLGMTAFSQLCDKYGNEVIHIPKAASAIRALRNQGILRDFSAGMKQSSIAIKYGLTERQINLICNRVKIDVQVDLFT